ncbi:uncharacterized protein Z520_07257 [Fonsecaea multimorphosa CBS 102226]|uniref:Hydantoinase/oxoprolinase N-terminal domain-containing protein n=1 Tax=Fonsecaea multimorphosa CBS 102226 TaxID=1442371 RepID=A0A0D2KKI2_9EURO|nr:uncharacterized protein Z520_07257 [Fonsecaea multimorphosa CBS 102226]KIX97143.1 hypothetical protein Z520_07257 [Fonsecaea multimorphosa CBS 102226]OAL22917.1 hypothetical protein AYO22_06825 [Fonsecaea multimorphosa]
MGSIGITDTQHQRYRIGVDVGGTNTDAVLISLSPTQIVASYKAPTTPDVTTGITEAVHAVIQASNVALDTISCVIIGTTHFVNAVVQRSSSLQPVGVVRLCGGSEHGFGLGVPPFIDFPRDLRRLIATRPFFCHGGHQISGAEISPINEAELRAVAEELVKDGVFNVVVAGIYSPPNSAHEIQAGRILLERMHELAASSGLSVRSRVTLSHQISSLGFLARENAAILNAALRPLAERTIWGFQKAMLEIFQGSPCALYLTQNDGSVLNAPDAIDLPIRTFNSGPTNSIRGGEFLWTTASTGPDGSQTVEPRQDALVVIDIGGTTSDSGLLLPNGLPRMSSLMSLVGGVRTNFALPAVESVGLGGGSIVRVSEDHLTVGPDSVALELPQKARLFGGDVLTATDIVAASELYSPSAESPLRGLGDPARLRDVVTPETVKRAKKEMRRIVEELVDRTKVQKGDVDVLIVGGGAILIDTDEQPLAGVRAVRKVKGGEVANAVGAAISRVSGIVDTVMDTSQQTLREAQEIVSRQATDAAVVNGARRETVEIAEVTILPIQYVDAKARILVRAVGTLDVVKHAKQGTSPQVVLPDLLQQNLSQTSREGTSSNSEEENEAAAAVDLPSYSPRVENREWIISATDLEWIASGCKILGCGGGGDPYQQFLKITSVLKKAPGSIKVVSADDLREDAVIGWTGCMGSPEVSLERMEADECNKAQDELTRVLGIGPMDGFMAVEIGGGNGMVNLEVAAAHGVVTVDADLMGRAYPTFWQTTVNVYGSPRGEALVPATIASGDGSFMTMTASRTDRLVDSALRAATVEMGCRAGKAGPPKTAKVVREQAILHTVSLAWWIGRAVALEKNIADRAKRIVDAVGGEASARILAEGKITSVERVLKTGHSYGVVEIDGILSGSGAKATVRIPFKNENAFVEATSVTSEGIQTTSVLASVPDLIAVLDLETGAGLGTPEYKYGLKVVVVAIAASPRWTDTPRGLELGGPGSMGFDHVPYVPIGKYTKPRSVIETFS